MSFPYLSQIGKDPQSRELRCTGEPAVISVWGYGEALLQDELLVVLKSIMGLKQILKKYTGDQFLKGKMISQCSLLMVVILCDTPKDNQYSTKSMPTCKKYILRIWCVRFGTWLAVSIHVRNDADSIQYAPESVSQTSSCCKCLMYATSLSGSHVNMTHNDNMMSFFWSGVMEI